MTGIFYDPAARRLRTVEHGVPDPAWTFVTHDLRAGTHQCRRILREWLPADVVAAVVGPPPGESAAS
jgi:hypothetical protein